MPNATNKDDRNHIACRVFDKRDDFNAFFSLYNTLVTQVTQELAPNDASAESSIYHDGIIQIIQLLSDNAGDTLDALLVKIRNQQSCIPDSEIEHALNIAVQTMIMVDSTSCDKHPPNYKLGGYRPTSWDGTESFVNFVQRTFERNMSLDQEDELAIRTALENLHALEAWELQKIMGLTIKPTEKLAEHLLLDDQNNILYVFHHAAFLKAHLERSRTSLDSDSSFEESLAVGTLPPQLLLETLHSLQYILFPSGHEKSARTLTRLVKKKNFDKECLQYDGLIRFPELPDDFTYVYWGLRLAKLHKKTFQIGPRTRKERWFRWYPTGCNLLLIALFISISVGIVSNLLASMQTWISWRMWKHPIK